VLRFVVLENVDMKKIGLLAVAVALMLSVGAFAGEKAANTKAPSQTPSGEVKAKGRGKAPDAATLEKELATLKQDHQAAMKELQDIKKLAADEKATKTAAALDKLIARHEQEYQKKVEPVQKRLDALKQAKGGDKDKDKGGDDKGGKGKGKGKGKG
jgi:hypothetical protein